MECLDDRPLRRPTMIQVIVMFKELQMDGDGSSGSDVMDGLSVRRSLLKNLHRRRISAAVAAATGVIVNHFKKTSKLDSEEDMEATKEKILNVNASALSGLNKVTAIAQEKVEKMTTSDPLKKENAELRKEEKIRAAEAEKQRAFNENAIHKEQSSHTGIGGQATHQNNLGVHTNMVGGQNHSSVPNEVSTIANPTGHGDDIGNNGVQTTARAGAFPTGHVGGVDHSGVRSTPDTTTNPAKDMPDVHQKIL